MTAIAYTLTVIGVLGCFATLAAVLLGMISIRTMNGALAICNGLLLVSGIMRDSTTSAGISAGALAISLWLWWNGGGDDDTKRRLRDWGRKFQGVRRTAPVSVS